MPGPGSTGAGAGRGRQRLARGLLAVVLAGGVLAGAFGAGYRSSHAALGDASAYLQKGHTVAHVNATSGGADAQAARDMATGREHLEVVQVSPGNVYVVDNDTNEVYRLPTDTMKPEQVRPGSPGKNSVHVVSAHDRTYLVDSHAGTVTYLHGGDGTDRAAVAVPHAVDQMLVDSTGTGWALSSAYGELYEVRGSRAGSPLRVAARGAHPQLTLCADHPVVYLPADGSVTRYGERGPVRRVDVSPDPTALVSAPGADTDSVAIVSRRTGAVTTVDLDAGTTRSATLPGRAGHDLGRPVILRGRLYVPDYTPHQVLVMTLDPLRAKSFTPIPGTGRFDLFVRDGRVWANDGYAKDAVAFDADGHRTLDKGTGGGVTSDADGIPAEGEPDASSPPSATPSPRPSPETTVPPTTRPVPAGPHRAASFTVPDVAGEDKAAACDRLRSAGLTGECRLVAQPDAHARTGEVLRSDPEAGSRIRADRTVVVFYRGPAEVPDLSGLAGDAACQALTAVKLRCDERPGGLAGQVADVGKVTAQQPAAHARVPTGTRVTIAYPTQVLVPDVSSARDQPPAQACTAITQQTGLACQTSDGGSATDAGVPPGVVVTQAPGAGGGQDPDKPVVLTYYGSVTVPQVTGTAPDAACAALGAGLPCARNVVAAPPGTALNQVLTQDPPAGSHVAPGTQVRIDIATTDPVPLQRYRLGVDDHHANFIGTGGPPSDKWTHMHMNGSVYTTQVPGTVPVYVSRCTTHGCGEQEAYYFSQNPTPPNGNGATGWEARGVAFYAFGQVPSGGQALVALWDHATWVFGVQGSAQYNAFLDEGFSPVFTICGVWPGQT
ncbi:MAG TPA: PASTA domain-containing protein [Actinocatenispora sp.]